MRDSIWPRMWGQQCGERPGGAWDRMPIRTGMDLLRLQGDVVWAGLELTAKMMSETLLKEFAKKGDGQTPVMTLPGFTGPEFSLSPMNRFLRDTGYDAHSWGLGTNRGPRNIEYMDTLATLLGDRLKSMADDAGRPVSLIGQSLGGIYARELARRLPDEVDRVITLGSPAHVESKNTHHLNRMVSRAMRFYTGRRPEEHIEEVEQSDLNIHEPPPKVPLVAIYSPLDGVAAEETTSIPEEFLQVKDGVPRENLQIICSHCGMGVNPLVLLAVADRLAQDKENWVPFDPMRYAGGPARLLSNWFYPLGLRPRHNMG